MRYLTLMQRMCAEGWQVVAGRTHYTLKCGKELNLDGIVYKLDSPNVKYLWDYTWFARHHLTEERKTWKRGDVQGRFSSMAKRRTVFHGFDYATCAGVVISWILYNGDVVVEIVNRP